MIHSSEIPGNEAVASEAASGDARRAAIGFLRGEDNPFDCFVAGQSADDDFFRFHAPEIHAEAQAQIARAIEKYAQPEYRLRHQLYPTRALLVRGPRGAGKTHLLHAIQYREDGARDLFVRPRYFEKQYPFTEYVLKEILRTVLGAEESAAPSLLGWAAGRITRRLLVESLLSLTTQDWLERTVRPRGLGILVGRRWKKQQMLQQALVRELNADESFGSPAEICRRHGLDRDVARTIVSHHLLRCEVGTHSLTRMRRQLLLALVDLGLSGTAEPFTTFVESGFAEQGDALPATRAALVDVLLRTLIEILAAAGVPVVVAFDNIERLLAPFGQLDLQVAQAFFSGLAQLIDGVHGVLVLLFVEDGLWIQCAQQAIDSFARDRLLLGIRMRDYGHVAELQLGPPSAELIEAMVRRRMEPLRARIEGAEKLPGLFPFELADVRAVAGYSNDVLRAGLLRLRDRYDELVLSRVHRPSPTAGRIEPDTALSGAVTPHGLEPERVSQLQVEREVLQPRWDSAVSLAIRRLETTPSGSLAGELHAGLGRWLETLVDIGGDTANPRDGIDWRLLRVDSGITFGDHPTFGLLTVAHWQPVTGGAMRRVGIGLVLGTGSGMPRDLSVKLSALQMRPPLIDELVLLWPHRDPDFQPGSLPAASRKVWEERARQHQTVLCGLPTADAGWLLAFNDWASDTADLAQPGWPDRAARQFLFSRTRSLLQALVPRSRPPE